MPTRRPSPSEYDDFYAGYIGRVPEGDILETLQLQREVHYNLLNEIPSEMADFRYAPGKWTVAEVLGHVIDAERLFGYRALHFARGGTGAIPGMDQDVWAAHAPYQRRSLASIIEEMYLLRGANVKQFQAFDEETLDRVGVASGVEFSVRALLYIMAGHEKHHVSVLRARYLEE